MGVELELARLKERHEYLVERFENALETSLDERKELRESVQRIEQKLAHHVTFIGGVIFTVSALWAFFLSAKDHIAKWLTP